MPLQQVRRTDVGLTRRVESGLPKSQENNRVTRREKLELMLADEPQDQMLRYMLSQELDKEADHDRSLSLLRSLMDDEPSYVPAFLMAGQQFQRLGRGEEAKSAFAAGIEAARQQGDDHARDELTRFLEEMG